MRKIAVVTVGRSDFGILRPILQAIQDDPEFQLQLIVTGAHLSPEFGWTSREITEAGFSIAESVDVLLSADTPAAISKSMGLALIGLAQAYERLKPDLLLVMGDRFEMHAAALAAVPFRIPIAHLHGGEVTRGAIDDALRHAITKYSHLHFASTQEHAERILQLGEQPWRVYVSGAPALDNLASLRLYDRDELADRIGLSLDKDPVLVTYHPVTLEYDKTEEHLIELLAALEACDRPLVFTKPNADTNGRTIIARLEEFARGRPHVRVVDSLGTRGYFSMMSIAAAMVGNSSSGIIEAASFQLPVVNIGIRQQGRPRSGNVLDVPPERSAIAIALRRALDPQFKAQLKHVQNVYGTGNATKCIVNALKQVRLDEQLIMKIFHDLPFSGEPPAAAA